MLTERNSITISDVAEALGISKTTVSRAISGKGRISEETREKVMAYIEEHDYRPNPLAKGLADQKTYNICWAMPGDSSLGELPFFQRCMIGLGEAATAFDYDILMAITYEGNISQLKRIVSNKKVDGVVLGRTLVDDENVRFLKQTGIPYVVIGSTPEKNVIQIDNDHMKACTELTAILLLKGIKSFALIGGDVNHVVNQTRYKGFLQALDNQGMKVNEDTIFTNCITEVDIERAVDAALSYGVECIICMDDGICNIALSKLHRDSIRIPEDIMIASFYNSSVLENHQPAITTLKYDPKELGSVAFKVLKDVIEGNEVQNKVLLGYEVLIKGSTR